MQQNYAIGVLYMPCVRKRKAKKRAAYQLVLFFSEALAKRERRGEGREEVQRGDDALRCHLLLETKLLVSFPCIKLASSSSSKGNPLLEALLGNLPVDDVPDGVEVLCLAVLVLEASTCVSC